MRLFRLAKILSVVSRFGIDEIIFEHEPSGRLAALSRDLQRDRAMGSQPGRERTWGLQPTPQRRRHAATWWALAGLVGTTFAFLGVNMFLSGLDSYGEL